MTIVVVAILAVVWALYLASWYRSRAQIRTANSLSSFQDHLSVLGRTQGHGGPGATDTAPAAPLGPATPLRPVSLVPVYRDPMVRPPQVRGLLAGPPVTRRDAQRRRRELLVVLVGLVAVTAAPAMVLGGAFAYGVVASVALLGAYLFFMLRAQNLAAERRDKVHYLPQARARVEADPVLARLAR